MSLIDDSAYWTARANEARITADCLADSGCRYILLRIAEDYDRIGQWIEEQDSEATKVDGMSARRPHP